MITYSENVLDRQRAIQTLRDGGFDGYSLDVALQACERPDGVFSRGDLDEQVDLLNHYSFGLPEGV